MKYRSLLYRAVRGISPGDEEHRKLMTASKISAAFVPSHSPYESRYGLYLKLAGVITGDSIVPEVAERGHMMEPTCAAWFQHRHREFNVRDPHKSSPATWFMPGDSRMAATPDRIIEQGGDVVALLECKTANYADGWGADGTDEIPRHYYEQCQWQMACTGTDTVYVAAIVAMRYREYKVTRDEHVIDQLYAAAAGMLSAVEREDMPDITEPENLATYEAVRASHPLIDPDGVVNLDYPTAHDYLSAVEGVAAAKQAETAAKTRLLDAMGDAKTAVFGDLPIATRQARGESTPYPVRARQAPTAESLHKPRNPFHLQKVA